MSVESRLSKLEGTERDADHRVLYVASQQHAADARAKAARDGKRAPLCVITNNPDQEPPILDGGTVRALLERVALNGKRIFDLRTPNP